MFDASNRLPWQVNYARSRVFESLSDIDCVRHERVSRTDLATLTVSKYHSGSTIDQPGKHPSRSPPADRLEIAERQRIPQAARETPLTESQSESFLPLFSTENNTSTTISKV